MRLSLIFLSFVYALSQNAQDYYPVYHYGPIEGTRLVDDNWGCTYRNIQTIMDRLTGSAPTILEIIATMNEIGKTVEYGRQRPFQLEDWLEPHDVYMYLEHLGLAQPGTALYNVHNGKTPNTRSYYKKGSFGPQFQDATDQEFLSLVQTWKQNGGSVPITVDDGISAYLILDYLPSSKEFIIADPHKGYATPLKRNLPVDTTLFRISVQEFFQITNSRTQYRGNMVLFVDGPASSLYTAPVSSIYTVPALYGVSTVSVPALYGVSTVSPYVAPQTGSNTVSKYSPYGTNFNYNYATNYDDASNYNKYYTSGYNGGYNGGYNSGYNSGYNGWYNYNPGYWG